MTHCIFSTQGLQLVVSIGPLRTMDGFAEHDICTFSTVINIFDFYKEVTSVKENLVELYSATYCLLLIVFRLKTRQSELAI